MGESQSQTTEERPVINEMICAQIHVALHNSFEESVTINGVVYPKFVYKNGCPYIDYGNVRFITQNKQKSSKYAARARAGTRITWGMQPVGDWIYCESEILDDKVLVSLAGMKREY